MSDHGTPAWISHEPPTDGLRLDAETANGAIFVINPQTDQRRQRITHLVLALRQLTAAQFTVEELGILILVTDAAWLSDEQLARIEAIGQRLLPDHT